MAQRNLRLAQDTGTRGETQPYKTQWGEEKMRSSKFLFPASNENRFHCVCAFSAKCCIRLDKFGLKIVEDKAMEFGAPQVLPRILPILTCRDLKGTLVPGYQTTQPG